MTDPAPLWTDHERAVWRPPPRQTVSAWADANRLLTAKESAEPGRWITARTPYLRAPQDALSIVLKGLRDGLCVAKVELERSSKALDDRLR